MTPPSRLPRGTPTFLFTDIEGSTRLLGALGDRYPPILARHRTLLVEAFEAHGGVVFGSEGDALFVAFEAATSAVAAAIAAQRSLAAERWPDGASIRVRMGMHTGEVAVVDDDYVGMSVHVAARVAAAGHGGQILVTEVTATLAGEPPAVDLGRHRLKDVGEHRLLQLQAPGLDVEFPPLRTLSSLPNNLPASVDEFVGRRDELADLLLALDGSRLITLAGPGGSGKTRLALEAGGRLLARFVGGVWLVDLAAVDDAARVASAVAGAIGVRQRGDEALADTLEAWLRDRQLLLILDNCEHLLDGVAQFCSRFLAACPDLRILATSRAVLGVRGEQAVQVPPLQTPGDEVDSGHALRCDAVELFVIRAVAAAPSFDVTRADIAAIAGICRRLDGLPLAIELAAARMRALSVVDLAARLDDRFRLLTAGSRADVARHQTLRAVVAWSYDLLDDQERQLFERLAAFPHHFDLEMAEAVGAAPPIDVVDVVDLLTQLVEKSLVTSVPVGDGVRYQLLETLRAYGLERLEERGGVDEARDRLLGWSMRVVTELEAVIRTPAMDDALRRATRDAPTHRAASQWAVHCGRPTDALRIASMVPLSIHRGERMDEIRRHLADSGPAGALDPAAEGHAWAAIGNMSFEAGDWQDSAEANARAAEAFRRAGLPRLAAWSEYLQVHSHWGAGELETLDRLLEQAIEQFRSQGDEMGLGFALWIASQRHDDLAEAERAAAEADRLLRKVVVPMGIAHNVEGRGIIALEDGRLDDAARFVAEAVHIFSDYENLGCAAHALEAAAVVLAHLGEDDALAIRLLGAAERFRERSGQSHRPWEVRARGGATADRVADLDAALRSTGRPADGDLHEVTTVTLRALTERSGARRSSSAGSHPQ